MGLLALVLVLVLAPAGACAVICCVGWWATVRARLEHEQRMFVAREEAKLRSIEVTDRSLRSLGGGGL